MARAASIEATDRLARLVPLLRCPRCGDHVEDRPPLCCPAGHAYQVVEGVPFMVEPAWQGEEAELARATEAAFGAQWVSLGDYARVSREDLLLHLPEGWDAGAFRGLVLDAGCGSGRYTALAADLGAEAIGLDPSESVLKAARMWATPLFVRADIVAAPFEPGTFDLVFSFGVIHHLPDPPRGLRACFALVRPGGRLLAWVYAERGGLPRQGRRWARRLAAAVPALTRPLAALAAVSLWLGYLLPRRMLGMPAGRLRFYAGKGLRQLYVDCHDALAAPSELYLTRRQAEAWLDPLEASARGVEERRDGSGWLLWAVKAR